MLQSKKQSRYGAIKLLDFATTRFAPPCDKLVDLGGLKHLFGIFMGKARIKGPRGEADWLAQGRCTWDCLGGGRHASRGLGERQSPPGWHRGAVGV